MAKSKLTKTSEFLLYLLTAEELIARGFEPVHAKMHRALHDQPFWYKSILYPLVRNHLISVQEEQGIRFCQLTKKGKLKALLAKIQQNERKLPWDGKWRLVIFDIPETSRKIRNELRRILIQQNFLPIQKSVFISPFEISISTDEYLIESGLVKYVRIMRIDRIDDDKSLRKRFKLN